MISVCGIYTMYTAVGAKQKYSQNDFKDYSNGQKQKKRPTKKEKRKTGSG